jgi:biotin carboxyl carrier protein
MATTERRAPQRRDRLSVVGVAGAVTALALLFAGCGHRHEAAEAESESWQVTAWGERYELFPEVDPLIAGSAAPAHTHVTVLDGFRPLTEGRVEIVLRNESGEQVFDATTPVRPGIYNVDVAPSAPGEYELLFRIDSAAGREEIRGGAVRVGGANDPGGIVRAPAPRGATEASEPVPFLKEQQWRTAFATDWVRRGALPESARGLGRVRPPAGGDVTLTASLDGVLQSTPWPYPGQEVAAGAQLFRIVPRTASEQSLAGLRAAVAGLEAEEGAARARAARLEELLAREATSRREVEDARALATSLAARLDAARRDVDAESAAREGRSSAEASAVRAPFAGRVAAVTASPGAAVAAGEPLGRVVRSGLGLARARPGARRGARAWKCRAPPGSSSSRATRRRSASGRRRYAWSRSRPRSIPRRGRSRRCSSSTPPRSCSARRSRPRSCSAASARGSWCRRPRWSTTAASRSSTSSFRARASRARKSTWSRARATARWSTGSCPASD